MLFCASPGCRQQLLLLDNEPRRERSQWRRPHSPSGAPPGHLPRPSAASISPFGLLPANKWASDDSSKRQRKEEGSATLPASASSLRLPREPSPCGAAGTRGKKAQPPSSTFVTTGSRSPGDGAAPHQAAEPPPRVLHTRLKPPSLRRTGLGQEQGRDAPRPASASSSLSLPREPPPPAAAAAAGASMMGRGARRRCAAAWPAHGPGGWRGRARAWGPLPPRWERSGGEMRETEKGEDKVGEEWLGAVCIVLFLLTFIYFSNKLATFVFRLWYTEETFIVENKTQCQINKLAVHLNKLTTLEYTMARQSALPCSVMPRLDPNILKKKRNVSRIDGHYKLSMLTLFMQTRW
jgi:hypothetical protein